MAYFVIGPDGTKYGPAEIPVLKSWVAEGRILATTQLEDSVTGQRVAARDVAELEIGPTAAPPAAPPTTPPPSNPPTFQQPRPSEPIYGQQSYGQPYGQPAYQRPAPVNVDTHLPKAIFATICCCGIFGIVAIVYAAMAGSKAGSGDSHGAMECADKADTWANWAIGLGLASNIIYWAIFLISKSAS